MSVESAVISSCRPVRRVGEEVPVLVNRAPLYRHAVPDGGKRLLEPRRTIDNDERRPPQPALDEVVEDRAPGFNSLAAHALDREQYLLAVLARADHHQQRDRSGRAVEPDANNGAVENEPHDWFFLG